MKLYVVLCIASVLLTVAMFTLPLLADCVVLAYLILASTVVAVTTARVIHKAAVWAWRDEQ